MRPVTLPDDGTNYDEIAYKAVEYRYDIDGTDYQDSIENIALQLKVLIDVWATFEFAYFSQTIGKKRRKIKLRKLSDDADDNIALNEKFDALYACIKADPEYGFSRFDLISAIGSYCSYCELPISSVPAVEHRLPKAYFPALFLNWSNFLLACTLCNSTKGDLPNQHIGNTYEPSDVAQAWLETHYAWSQSYWKNYTGLQLPFEYKLRAIVKNRTGWTFGDIVSPNQLGILVDEFEKGSGGIQDNAFCIATGDPAKSPNHQRFFWFALEIQPATSHQVPAPTKAAVRNIIDVAGLNKIPRATMAETTDYRVALRTLAYFRALKMRRIYDQTIQLKIQSAAIDDMMSAAIRATGFWGVWQTVFKDSPAAIARINNAIVGSVKKQWIV